MKGLFDLMTIIGGTVGLVGLVLTGTPLTPENAALQATRVIIVMAFVIIPFCMARAIEKVEPELPGAWLQSVRAFNWRRKRKVQQEQSDMLFFDYFFQPGSANEWKSPSKNIFEVKGLADDTSSD